MSKNPAAVTLGRLGGIAKSERKTAAVRANAKLPRRRQTAEDALRAFTTKARAIDWKTLPAAQRAHWLALLEPVDEILSLISP